MRNHALFLCIVGLLAPQLGSPSAYFSPVSAAYAPTNTRRSRAVPKVPTAALELDSRSRKFSERKRLAENSRPSAPESTIVVTNCGDAGGGSLRDAAQRATGENTIIDLGQLSCSRITLTTGAISIAADANWVQLIGPGSRITIDAGSSSGRHNSAIYDFGDRISLTRVNIENASYIGINAAGGCIWASGAVDLVEASLSNCSVSPPVPTGYLALGGGVFCNGLLSMQYSSITNSSATTRYLNAYGGGVFTGAGVAMHWSTISDNSASGVGGYGGGVFAQGNDGSLVYGSTVSGNRATTSTGGLLIRGPGYLLLEDSTISGNASVYGVAGGITATGAVNLFNTTVAENTAASNGVQDFGYHIAAGLDVFASQTVMVSTLIANNRANFVNSDVSETGGSTFSGIHNLVVVSYAALPSDTISTDPQLLPLTNNGGPTKTHALAAGSPAIDAGFVNGILGYDQRYRGFPRVIGRFADIGAYETKFNADSVFANGFD